MCTLKSWAILTQSVLTSFPADVYTDTMHYTYSECVGTVFQLISTLKSWALLTLSVLTSFPADVFTEIMGLTYPEFVDQFSSRCVH